MIGCQEGTGIFCLIGEPRRESAALIRSGPGKNIRILKHGTYREEW